jgi:putative glycosyltransferase (TIGR04372 family)
MVRRILLSLRALILYSRRGEWGHCRAILIKMLREFFIFLLFPIGFIFLLVIRGIRPIILVRLGGFISERIGHFAGNTELYLCEIDAAINCPEGKFVDLWYHNWPISNHYLGKMWGSVIKIGPSLLLASIDRINLLVPGGEIHRIGLNTFLDRDVHNLFDKYPPHLSFSDDEHERGRKELSRFGVPADAKFVCVIVRDSSYLNSALPWTNWSRHDHRDCNIANYYLAAEALAERGYYVFRMGVKVHSKFETNNERIIDYANSGMGSDFMDVYLGAHCSFCISTTTGFDAIPYVFRRPIVFTDMVPLFHVHTFSSRYLSTAKKYWSEGDQRFLSFREMLEPRFENMLAGEFQRLGIKMVESSPEEICDVVLEMESMISGTWQSSVNDEELQKQFWNIFPKGVLHGEFRGRIGRGYLRSNSDLL